MTSGERLAASIDAAYEELTATLPASLRAVAARLPYRLGLTSAPDGAWGEFVALAPNRDLPSFAADAHAIPPARRLSAERLRRFRRAHHYGGFSWLLRDRIADGQVLSKLETSADGDALSRLDVIFHERWRQALVAATEDTALVDAGIAEVTARWRRGTRGERLGLRRGVLAPATYATLVRDKLAWIGLAAISLLADAAGPGAAQRFRLAHDLFLLGLQAIDDVNDTLEDLLLYGSAVSVAIDVHPAVLLKAAPRLVLRASSVAAEAGFSLFSSWLSTFATTISGWRAGPAVGVDDSAVQEGQAEALANLLERGLHDGENQQRRARLAADRDATSWRA